MIFVSFIETVKLVNAGITMYWSNFHVSSVVIKDYWFIYCSGALLLGYKRNS